VIPQYTILSKDQCIKMQLVASVISNDFGNKCYIPSASESTMNKK